ALHRFVFHIQFPLRDPRLREFVNASHLAHHASPRDPRRLLVHPLYGLVISTVLYAGLLALSRNAFSAAGIMAGNWTGFLLLRNGSLPSALQLIGVWLNLVAKTTALLSPLHE